jgi:hypothetical protein
MRDLTIQNPGWDGMYVRGAEGLEVTNCVFDQPYRNGVSVIDAVDVVFTGCTFSNSLPNGTAALSPMAGVDLEPNHPRDRLVNISFIRCNSVNNSGAGYQVFPAKSDETSTPMSVSFIDCNASGIGRKPLMAPAVPDGYYLNSWGGQGARGHINVVRGFIRGTNSFGAAVYTHGANDALVTFDGTVFDHVAVKSAPFDGPVRNSPLAIASLGSAMKGHAMGMVEFRDVTVVDNQERPFLLVDGKGSLEGLQGVSGTVNVRNPKHSAAGCKFRVVSEPAGVKTALQHNLTIHCLAEERTLA